MFRKEPDHPEDCDGDCENCDIAGEIIKDIMGGDDGGLKDMFDRMEMEALFESIFKATKGHRMPLKAKITGARQSKPDEMDVMVNIAWDGDCSLYKQIFEMYVKKEKAVLLVM